MNSAPARLILAVDSDGTVLDAMTPKHRDGFTPALIDIWELHSIAARATEAFLRINLRSTHRGLNRFEALGLLLRELSADAAPLPPLDALFTWIDSASALSERSLEAALDELPGDAGLARALAWSREVNRRCAAMSPPAAFPGAADALRAATEACTVTVVSGGNGAAIRSEWAHAGLASLASEFLTQEAGPKTAILRRLVANAASPDHVLMLGDSPPDEAAAREVGTRFFPIIPGHEAECWRTFHHEVLPAFRSGKYDEAHATPWRRRFHAALGA